MLDDDGRLEEPRRQGRVLNDEGEREDSMVALSARLGGPREDKEGNKGNWNDLNLNHLGGLGGGAAGSVTK